MESVVKTIPDTVEVYDSVNKNRLLGTIEKRSLYVHDHEFVRLAVLDAPLTAHAYRPDAMPDMICNVETIDLRREWKRPDPWTAIAFYTTYTSLQTLMKHRGFMLPGETPFQADQRRWIY